MFTGIIQSLGSVSFLKRGKAGLDLGISPPKAYLKARLGESIAVNGICLTVKEKTPKELVFFCQKETLDKTGVSFLKTGERVNLERAMKLSDRLGGHLVQGHVDGVVTLEKEERIGESRRFWVRWAGPVFPGLVLKGSVALDGISLTISRLTRKRLAVDVIPHTFSHTNIPLWKKAKRINLEADLIGKHVDAFMKGRNR